MLGEDVTQREYTTHNKGARFSTPVESIEGWRIFMEHYILKEHAACVSALIEDG